MADDTSGQTVKIQQVKSEIGYDRKQRATLRGLGLRKIRQIRELEDTPAVRGMINKVRHLVVVLED
ncbi:MAG: 50S ribosomal protein L30 [bacterium]|nr:50S ribosomal protein L30 [bacterium]